MKIFFSYFFITLTLLLAILLFPVSLSAHPGHSTFTHHLSLGSSGEDVRTLQKFLNTQGFTIALSGPGSSGFESTYFGPATRNALARFQAANGITPAQGYFGQVTRDSVIAKGGGSGGGVSYISGTGTSDGNFALLTSLQSQLNTLLLEYTRLTGKSYTPPTNTSTRTTTTRRSSGGGNGSSSRNNSATDNNVVANPTNTTTSDLFASCVAGSPTALIGQTVTFIATPTGGSGSGTYSYSWSGATGSGANATNSYSSTGVKTATVTVTSGSLPSKTATCSVTINPPVSTETPLNLSCTANPTSAKVQDNVTYVANATGGTGTYSYSWSGTDSLSGTGSFTSKFYSTIGTKTANLSVTSGSQSKTASCTSTVTEPLHTTASIPSTISTVSGAWSNPATWGTSGVPQAGTNVTIPAGRTITLDQDINVASLMIHGTLDMARKDLNITSGYIMVMDQGRFLAGTEGNPFLNNLTITLNGTDAAATAMGGRSFTAMNGGHIELFGKPSAKTWTMLNATAPVGATSITLDTTVDWKVGDEIIITTTEYDFAQTEKRRITGISGTNISLNQPLQYSHYGQIECFNHNLPNTPKCLDERAEVGLLSHNIKIQGSSDSLGNILVQNVDKNGAGQQVVAKNITGFGAHVMIMNEVTPSKSHDNDPSVGRFVGVEFTHVGQNGILGRYPVHFHNLNNQGANSYVKSSSVNKSFSRFMTIHKTNNVLLENNVAYDTIGHGYFIEDGKEIRNVLRGNLGALVKPGALFNTDDMPTVFWTANPNNDYIGNVAAGSSGGGVGFWIELPSTPAIGTISVDASYNPKEQPFGIFRDNRVHSIENRSGPNSKFDIKTHQFDGPIGFFVTNETGSITDNFHTAVFDGFTSFKVDGLAMYFKTDMAQGEYRTFKNWRVTGGMFFNHGATVMENSLGVGRSRNEPVPPLYGDDVSGEAMTMYNTSLRMKENVFVNYNAVYSRDDRGMHGEWCADCRYINSYIMNSNMRFAPPNMSIIADPDDSLDNGTPGVKDPGFFVSQARAARRASALVTDPFYTSLLDATCIGSEATENLKGTGRPGAKGIHPEDLGIFWCPRKNYPTGMLTLFNRDENPDVNNVAGYTITRADGHSYSGQYDLANPPYQKFAGGTFVGNQLNRLQLSGNFASTNLIKNITVSRNGIEGYGEDSDKFTYPIPLDAHLELAIPAPSTSLSVRYKEHDLPNDIVNEPLIVIKDVPLPPSPSFTDFKNSAVTTWIIHDDPTDSYPTQLYLKVFYQKRTELVFSYGGQANSSSQSQNTASVFSPLNTKPSIGLNTASAFSAFGNLYGTGSQASVYESVQTPTANYSVSTPVFTFYRNLKLYDEGEDVRELQKYLNAHGFLVAESGPGSPGLETPIFGRQTSNALIRWQASVLLPPTGVFGDQSREAVQAMGESGMHAH